MHYQPTAQCIYIVTYMVGFKLNALESQYMAHAVCYHELQPWLMLQNT